MSLFGELDQKELTEEERKANTHQAADIYNRPIFRQIMGDQHTSLEKQALGFLRKGEFNSAQAKIFAADAIRDLVDVFFDAKHELDIEIESAELKKQNEELATDRDLDYT